jgi:tetratricopeptide (TPR) repeat protein
MRGELDWIVMKCLEKDRSRRYETVNGLARDVQRFLTDEVVEARPPSAGYRLRKFLRRNRGPLLVSSALAVSVLAGVGGMLAVELKAGRDRAAVAADRAAREAGTTASINAAVSEARKRAAEAWDLFDYPDRMRSATDAALAALKRADGFVASGSPTKAALARLTTAQSEVDDLARHTRLVTACFANQRQFAEDLNTNRALITMRREFARRQREELLSFGLDVVGADTNEVARAIAASPLRDTLIGMLFECRTHEAYVLETWRNWKQKESTLADATSEQMRREPVPDPVVKERLEQAIRASRQACGGAYARWQDLLDRKDVAGLVAFAASPEALFFRSILVVSLAADLYDRGELAANRTFLRAAADRYPHDVWLQRALYLNCVTSEPPNWPEALRYASAASVQWPDCGLFQICVGQCYDALGSYDEAIAAYRKAMSLYANPGYAYLCLGVTLRRKNDLDGAIAAMRECVRLMPTYSAAQSRLDLMLKEKEKWDRPQARTSSDLDRLQGKWERLWATEPGPFGNARRAVKEINRDTEIVTWFDAEGKVLRSQRVTFQLFPSGYIRMFTYSNMEVLDGPDKGQKFKEFTGSCIYVLDQDTFYEALNLFIGSVGQPPELVAWKRLRP